MKGKRIFYTGQSVSNTTIIDNLIKFIDSKNIVYRGVSSIEVPEEYIRLLSDAGEKGTYFRKKEQLPIIGEEERKNMLYHDGKLDENEVASHARGSGNNSKYVSTTTDFEQAKSFSLDKKGKEKNAYIILAFIDKEDVYKNLKGTSLTEYSFEKEITFYHAIFPDRIIGIFSQDEVGEFALFHMNPDLYPDLKQGVPNKISTEQDNFEMSNDELGNELHTTRYD